MNVSYRAGLAGTLAGQIAERDLLPHPDRRQHSFARTAREGFPHHDAFRSRYAMEFVCRATMRRCDSAPRKNSSQELNGWLAEPLEDCLAVARDGSLCIESKSPVDIEDALGLYHGNIFQDAPTFPFAETKEQVGTWGVETEFENVFLCGSSAQRGGAVSGIPGHNAAMKVLETKDGL